MAATFLNLSPQYVVFLLYHRQYGPPVFSGHAMKEAAKGQRETKMRKESQKGMGQGE